MNRFISFLCVAIVSMMANAKVTLPQFFSDNMVLQQQTLCKLWGTATAGKTIAVRASWDSKPYFTKADTNGHFEIGLQTPKAGGPYTIIITEGEPVSHNVAREKNNTQNPSSVTLHNVLIGEVWICSGQSNMEMQMKGFKQQPVEGTTEELLRCKDSQLRLFTVKRQASLTPATDVTGQWSEANSASVRDFSATA